MDASSMTARLPRLANLEKPTSSLAAQSRMALHMEPEGEKKAIFPSAGRREMSEAFMRSAQDATPRQLGPSSVMFRRSASWMTASSR
jgi:hypothetical protein